MKAIKSEIALEGVQPITEAFVPPNLFYLYKGIDELLSLLYIEELFAALLPIGEPLQVFYRRAIKDSAMEKILNALCLQNSFF